MQHVEEEGKKEEERKGRREKKRRGEREAQSGDWRWLHAARRCMGVDGAVWGPSQWAGIVVEALYRSHCLDCPAVCPVASQALQAVQALQASQGEGQFFLFSGKVFLVVGLSGAGLAVDSS